MLLKVFRLAAPASGDPQAGGGIPVDRMLDLRAKLGEACGNPIEFLLVVSFQRPNDRRSIPHHIRHDVGQIGGAERVFGVHHAQVLIDLAQLLAAQPTHADDQQAEGNLRESDFAKAEAFKEFHGGSFATRFRCGGRYRVSGPDRSR